MEQNVESIAKDPGLSDLVCSYSMTNRVDWSDMVILNIIRGIS
jgi:hypothetical protein